MNASEASRATPEQPWPDVKSRVQLAKLAVHYFEFADAATNPIVKAQELQRARDLSWYAYASETIDEGRFTMILETVTGYSRLVAEAAARDVASAEVRVTGACEYGALDEPIGLAVSAR